MKRIFWITVGAGAALYAQRRAVRFARGLTPQNLAVRAVESAVKTGGLTTERLRTFAEEVRLNMAEREAELAEAIRLDQASEADPRRPQPVRILQARPINDNDSKDGTHGVG